MRFPNDESVITAENTHSLVGLEESRAGGDRLAPSGPPRRKRVAQPVAILNSLHLALPAAAPALISSIVIRGDRCEHGGRVSAVLATTDLDIESLDPARKAAASASFARMCHTLQSPMQLLVRVRRLAAPDAPSGDGPHPQLDAAMGRHWTEQIRDGNRHTRQVVVALVAATPAALDAACAHATDRLGALGVSATRLERRCADRRSY